MKEDSIRPGRALRLLVCSALLVTMTGCTVMAPVAGPRQYIPTHEPSVIWVKRADAAQTIAIEGPRVIGDTLVGFVLGEYTELPLIQVQSVRARQFSRSRTTALLIGMGALAVGLTFILSGGHGGALDPTDEEDIGFRRPIVR
jgi:hypothetical protein